MASAEQYANIISNLSNKLYCFNVFICYWRARAIRTSIVIDIFSAFLKPVIPQLNLCCARSRLAKVTVKISNVLAYLISFFTQNLIQFLWSIFFEYLSFVLFVKNKLTIQNGGYCQQTMCTNITETKKKKKGKSNICN